MAKNKAPPKKAKEHKPKRKRKKKSSQAPRWILQRILSVLEKTMNDPIVQSNLSEADRKQNELIQQVVANQDATAELMIQILEALNAKHEKNAAAIHSQQAGAVASAEALGKMTTAAKGVAEKLQLLKEKLGGDSQPQNLVTSAPLATPATTKTP